MFDNNNQYLEQFSKIFSRNPIISDVKPSVWAENNIVIPGGKGKLNYDYNPYCREIIDLFAPDHPMRKVVVMKGSQITFSSGVLMPLLGYIIAEDPHNTLFMVGDTKLLTPANEKLDYMITHAACDLRDLIADQSNRKRKTKSGDTDTVKYFPGGYILTDSLTNTKAIAQIDCERIILDDADAIKKNDPKTGAFLDLVEMRGAANYHTFKMGMIGTPLTKSESNLEPAFVLGDQRRWNIECPHCHDPIKWERPGSLSEGGFIWKEDNHNHLVENSVEYICPKCACAHNDRNKQKQLQGGLWIPENEHPVSKGYYSYRISSLYAPVGMNPWSFYIGKYLEANPKDAPRNEFKHQTLVNTGFGETYEPAAHSPSANSIQKNIRNYPVGMLPEKLSIADGNGRIILVTCAADMNGTVDDARLDFEVVAWSEQGASYSIQHGSIGTFIPREGQKKADRLHWTYEAGKPNNVWDEFNKIIFKTFSTDTGRQMQIFQTGLDCGYFSHAHAYPFIDRSNPFPRIYVVGLKGKGQDEYVRYNKDLKYFTPARERPNLFSLTVGKIKDELADFMQLRWGDNDPCQPFGFMNFPTPSDGLYGFTNYFEHYESEHCVTEALKDGTGVASRWQKKNSAVMNHMWDVRVYNMAMREIIIDTVRKELKEPKLTWKEFVVAITGGK